MIDAGLYISYGLLFVTIAATIILPLINALKDPKSLIRSLMGVGVLLVLFLVAYAVSGSEVTAKSASLGVGAGGSKLVSAGLIMFYITLVGAIVGVVYSEISKAFK